MTDPADTARACFDAYVRGDRAALEALIADPFRFTSPYDNGIDRATYFARCWPNHHHLRAFDLVRVVAHGTTAVVTYEATTDTGKRFRNTEVITVKGGRIAEVEVYFGWDLPHAAAPGGFTDPR